MMEAPGASAGRLWVFLSHVSLGSSWGWDFSGSHRHHRIRGNISWGTFERHDECTTLLGIILVITKTWGCEDKETRACCPSLELSTTLAEIFRLHQHIIKANRWAAPGTWLQLIALRRLIQQKSTTAQTASFWAVLTKSASISQPCRPSLRKYSNIVQRMFAYFSQTNFRQQQMMLRLLSKLARNSFLHPGQYIPMKQSIRIIL